MDTSLHPMSSVSVELDAESGGNGENGTRSAPQDGRLGMIISQGSRSNITSSGDSTPASSPTPLRHSESKKERKRSVVRINFLKGWIDTPKKERPPVMENDDFKLQFWFKMYMLIPWAIAFAITIWYTVQITDQHKAAVRNPTSTTFIELKERLALPQVTICNWNQNSDGYDMAPLSYCPECDLNIESCSFNSSVECHQLWSKRYYITQAGEFTCWDFNSFAQTPLYSSTTGYSGAFATVWSVALYPRANPGPNVTLARAGLQVSFFAPGAITPDKIYAETRFAPVGYDSFYTLQLIQTIHSELDWFDPLYNTTGYVTPVTTLNVMSRGQKKLDNLTIGYIGISFAYQTMSQQTVLYGVSYTLSSLFGDLASIIGTMMGLDVIKAAVGFCLFFISWKHKDINLLADLFNG